MVDIKTNNMLITFKDKVPKIPWGLEITSSYFESKTKKIILECRAKESTLFFRWDGFEVNFDDIWSEPNVEIK